MQKSLLLIMLTFLLTIVGQAKAADVLLSPKDTVVTVGTAPVNFYDDGGKEGRTSSSFKGQVTFVPGVEGQKVQIDFTTVDIFEGSFYSQYIRVYNGREATAANLIREVRKGQPVLIHSTSSDGALTVVCGSTTTYTSNGFEALVSLFTPQPMTVRQTTVAQASTDNVAFGDAAQPMLDINITTEHTEPALTAGAFTFTAKGSAAQVAKATLSYTGTSTTFATTAKVGEATVSGDTFTITPDTTITLAEGDNHFWLTYDISDEAVDGSSVDAALQSVTVGNTTLTPDNGDPEGARTVKNIVYSHADQGTVSKTISGQVQFVTRTANEYSSRYETGDDDRVNIFTPAHEGYVCQIDFSQFDLYYSSSAYYGSKATFRIYAGKGTTGTLLWELNAAADKATGPGRIIRSTADDGSLTIVFNPNASYSSYTANGFAATVKEYKPLPMRYSGVSVTQATTDDISVGARKQPLLTLNVKTDGDQQPLSLKAVSLDLKGAQTSLDSLSVAAGGTTLASAAVSKEASTLTITLDEPYTLTEGDNLFTITADVDAAALSGAVIDAKVTAITVGDSTISMANGDPEGARTVVYTLNFASGDNGETTVGSDVLMFYDDGGKDGNESKGFSGTITFAPKKAGDAVRLTFNSWQVTWSDDLYIYMGGSVKDKEDYKYSKYDSPTTLFSTAADGKITLRYTTGSYSTDAGFAIEVSSFTPAPLAIDSVKAVNVAPAKVMKGQTDVVLQRIDVYVGGEKGSLDISSIAVSTTGEALQAARVYQTDTLSAFAPTSVYGEVSGGTARGSYTATAKGIYRFWVAADVKGDARVDATVGAQATAVNATAIAGSDMASTTVQEGLHGTYTIGKDGDYATIQSAIDALQSGIDGPVVLNVKAGQYNELVTIPAIPGQSAVNTVTLRSESGRYGDVRIYYDTYSEPSYSDDKMAHEYGVVTVDGACYFTLRGIEVTSEDLTFPGLVRLRNQSRHVTVDSCYIHSAISTEYRQDIDLVYLYSKDVANSNNDFFTLSNSLIEGGYYGAHIGGTSYVKLPKEKGARIIGNTFRNNGNKAIYVMKEDDLTVSGNTITNDAVDKSGFQAMDIQAENGARIEGNVISLRNGNSVTAFGFRKLTGTAEAPVIVANNEVNIHVGGTGNSAAFKVSDPSDYVTVAYNTVNITKAAQSVAFWLNDNMSHFNVVNNLWQNTAGGYVYRFYKTENIATATYSHNNGFTTGSTYAYDKTSLSLADWLTASGETDSHNDSIAFADSLLLMPTSAAQLRTALPLTSVATDIEGTGRDQATPTIGAYEWTGGGAIPAMAVGYPKAVAMTDTTAVIALKSSVSAKAFILVKPATEAAPTTDELANAALTATLHAGKETLVTADSLSQGQSYVAYVLLRSFKGGTTTTARTEAFTAGSGTTPVATAIAITVDNGQVTIERGQELSLTATVSNATEPYTVTWTNGAHEAVEMPVSPEACDDYIVTVTDGEGRTASDTTRVIVTGEAATATFENLYLDKESYWNGYNHPNKFGSFVSGSYEFQNRNWPEYSSWFDFAYANVTSTTFRSANYLTDQFNIVPGKGHNSANYVVAYPQRSTITVLNRPEGDIIRGFYITNTSWVENAILHGDGMEGTTPDGQSFGKTDGFREGDYLYVDIIGVHADKSRDTMRVYLADYRSADAASRYYLKDWTWVDLTTLGNVTQLQFVMGSSRNNAYGTTTPTYFAMDDFNAAIPATGISNIPIARPDAHSSRLKAQSTKVYNLAGQLVGDDYKGVVIINGKKILRK